MRTKFLLVALIIAAAPAFSQGNIKIGHVNSQEIIQSMPEFEAAMTKLESIQTNNNEVAKKMQAEFQKKYDAYVAIAKSLTPAERQTREGELGEMDQKFRAYVNDLQQKMNEEQNKATAPIVEKARVAVEAVGKENGFTYIFDLSKGQVLFHGSSAIDVSELVKMKLASMPSVAPKTAPAVVKPAAPATKSAAPAKPATKATPAKK